MAKLLGTSSPVSVWGAPFLMTSFLWCLGHMGHGAQSQAYKQRDHLGAGSCLT